MITGIPGDISANDVTTGRAPVARGQEKPGRLIKKSFHGSYPNPEPMGILTLLIKRKRMNQRSVFEFHLYRANESGSDIIKESIESAADEPGYQSENN